MKKNRFRDRRNRFMDAMEDGIAIIPSGIPAVRNNDVEHPFRASSDFFMLTGFEEQEAWAVFRKKGDVKSFELFVRPFDPEQEVWMGRRAGVDGAVRDFGADAAFDSAGFFDALPRLLENQPRLYYAFGTCEKADARILGAASALKSEARRGVSGPWQIIDPSTITWGMRLVKSREDLADHRAACAITADAFRAAMKAVRPGMREFELAAVVEFEFARRGSKRLAFDTICAAGSNAATLHYTANDAPIGPDDMVLIDAGAELGMVTADISRTFPASGRFPEAGRIVYEWVLKAQKAAIKKVRPGVTYAEVHRAALEVLCKGLISMKVLSGDVESIINSGDYRPYFMHRIGHWLGLDVHDVGPYFVNGESIRLEPGMIITVEPGLYFRNQPEVPERFRNTGVRIEDDVLVTAGAARVLTDSVPKEVADIEKFMAEGPSWWDSLEPATASQN